MKEIFEISDLGNLKIFLDSIDGIKKIQEILFDEFLKYADYKNAKEWNKAVRICESLAIVGWGSHEPLEALRGIFYNGNPMTYFLNKSGQPRFVEAIWSKRKDGFTMEQGRTSFYSSSDDLKQRQSVYSEYEIIENIQDLKLESQRNWIPKNPIHIRRTISNCYENSKLFIESVEHELQPELDLKMCPEKYGAIINYIVIDCAYSYYDHVNCKTNYIIANSERKLSNKVAWEELHKMYSPEEIKKNGYYLRNRLEYGPFRLDTGKMKTTIHFEKEFSMLSLST